MRPLHHPSPPDDPVKALTAAYVTGLRWLALRELSMARVRERLLDRGFPAGVADQAIHRLQKAGALDEHRAAHACARTLVLVKHRGRLRVVRELERMGFTSDAIRDAVASVLEGQDERQMVERALATRLRGSSRPVDAGLGRRLFAALVRQGFAPSLVVDVLRRHRADPEEPAVED